MSRVVNSSGGNDRSRPFTMTDDLACPNCGGTDMKIIVIDSFGEDRVHIMAFCSLGGSCKVYPIVSARLKSSAVTIS